ncbi:hypothetical protein E2320_003931 [Naja naja]|nr:hypothetical protein E2320_003931 [Naja naja]
MKPLEPLSLEFTPSQLPRQLGTRELAATSSFARRIEESVQLAAVEKKYHILKEESVKFQDMENKISTISEKFASSSVLQEVASYVSMITNFEQELSTLHNFIEDIENSQQTCSKKFQTISKTFQKVVDSWKMSTSEMDTNTSNTKVLHSEIISQINTMDQGLKKLSERLKDLEDSTIVNLKTLNRQEENELLKIEQQLQLDKNTAELLKEEHDSILARSNDLYQKLVFSEHKLQECKTYLPIIENAIYSILRLSSELVATEIKKEDMITKVTSVENEIMKATTEIMNMQNTLEDMQSEEVAEQAYHSVNSIDISSYCEMAPSLTKQLEDLNVIPQMKYLQKEISIMQLRSSRLIQEEEELQLNLTSLSDAVAKHEEKTKGISIKIADVKTDIRRISGLQTDISLLIENLEILEDKVNKVEKAIIQNIGDLLTSSIDRTTKLRNIASENTREVKHIKAKSFELKADSTKQFNKLLELESDRTKVLTTVAFANELKPKVHNLKNDLAHLLIVLDELTLRIGRLLGDLLESQKELALLNKKLSNLTSIQTQTE